MQGFGMDIRGEGKPYHPDFFGNSYEFSEEMYMRQLKAYAECYGIEHTKDVMCTRPELLRKLVQQGENNDT